MSVSYGSQITFLNEAREIKADLTELSAAIKTNNASLIAKDLQQLLEFLPLLASQNLSPTEKKAAGALTTKILALENDINSDPTDPSSGPASSDASAAASSASSFESCIDDVMQAPFNKEITDFEDILKDLEEGETASSFENMYYNCYMLMDSLKPEGPMVPLFNKLKLEMLYLSVFINNKNPAKAEAEIQSMLKNFKSVLSYIKSL